MANKSTYRLNKYDVPLFLAAAFDVTPSDTTTYEGADGFPDGLTLLVKATGDVVVTPLGSDTDITLPSVPAYYEIPFRVKAVKATGTTASVVGIL